MKKHLFKRQFSKKNAFLYKIFCASILGSSLLLVQDQLATAGPKPNKQERYYKIEVENNPLVSNQPIRIIQLDTSKYSLSEDFTNINFKDEVYKGPNSGPGRGERGNYESPTQSFRGPDNTNTEQKNYISNIIPLDSNKIYIGKDHQSPTHLEEIEKNLQSRKSRRKLEPEPDSGSPISPTNNPFGWDAAGVGLKSTSSPTYHFRNTSSNSKVASNNHSNTENKVTLKPKKLNNKIKPISDIEAPISPTNNPFGWDAAGGNLESPNPPTYSAQDHSNDFKQNDHLAKKQNTLSLGRNESAKFVEISKRLEQNAENDKLLNINQINPETHPKQSTPPFKRASYFKQVNKKNIAKNSSKKHKSKWNWSNEPIPIRSKKGPAAKFSSPAASKIESNITQTDQITKPLPAAGHQQLPAGAIELAAGATGYQTPDIKSQVNKQNEFRKKHITTVEVEEDFIIGPIPRKIFRVDTLLSEGLIHDDLKLPLDTSLSPRSLTRVLSQTDTDICPTDSLTRSQSGPLQLNQEIDYSQEAQTYDQLKEVQSKLNQVFKNQQELRSKEDDNETERPKYCKSNPNIKTNNTILKEPRESRIDTPSTSYDEILVQEGGPKEEIIHKTQQNQGPKEENTQGTSQSISSEIAELKDDQYTPSTSDETFNSTPTNSEVAKSNQNHDTQPISDQISRQTKMQNYSNRVNLVHLQLHALQTLANHMETWSSHVLTSSNSILPAAGEYDEDSLPLLTHLMKKGNFVPWISGHYGKSIQGKVKDRAAYRADLGGFSIGTDFVLNECTVLGVSYTQITSKLKYRQDRLGDQQTTDSQTFGLYGQYNFNETLFAQSALAYTKGLTKHNLKNQESYKSSSKGFAGFVSLNNVFTVSKNTFIVPRVGLKYIQNKEKDVQVGDTKITGAKTRYLTAILGSKILFRKNYGEVSITPGLYAGLEQPIAVKNQGAKASIVEAGQTFEYQCPPSKTKNLSYNLGAEISAKRRNVVFSLSYQCSLAKKYASHQGSLKVGIAF